MIKLVFALSLVLMALKVAFISTVVTVGLYGYIEATINHKPADQVATCAKQGERTVEQCEAAIAFAMSGAGL